MGITDTINFKRIVSIIATKVRLAETKGYSERKPLFSDFAWEIGRFVSKLRNQMGWDIALLEKLSIELQKELGEKSFLKTTELDDFCDFYTACSKLSQAVRIPEGLLSQVARGVAS